LYTFNIRDFYKFATLKVILIYKYSLLVDHTERPIRLNMQAHVIERRTRISQGVIAPVITANFFEVDRLSESERGNLGFGSTGIK
jgi:dUTP pyrophosphatase